MSKTIDKTVEAFYATQEKQTLDNLLIPKDELLQIINESIHESKQKRPCYTINEILLNTADYILGLLYSNHRIPHLRIPHIIDSSLNYSERIQLQEQLETKFFRNNNNHHFNQNKDISPIEIIMLICESNPNFPVKRLLEKSCYSLAYMFERNLTSEEQNYVNEMLTRHLISCGTLFDIYLKGIIIDSFQDKLNESHQRSLEQPYEQNNPPVLYNLFLDTFLPEVLTSCIKRFFLSATENTITYYQLIKDCLELSGLEHYKDYIERETEIFRKYMTNSIHNNDNEKLYYQHHRGPKKLHHQNTLAQYEKDTYELMYLLHSRRKLKSSSKNEEFSQKEIDDLHAKLNNLLNSKLQYNGNSAELITSYTNYISYILNQTKLPKTVNMLEVAQRLIEFHSIIDDYFNKKPENDWYNKTSIFYAPWDFMQTAAYTWHHIPKDEPPYNRISIDHLTELYRKYCQQINTLAFPKTQLLLLENSLFFIAYYIESPLWMEDMPYVINCFLQDLFVINAVFETTSVVLREICNSSSTAFSHSFEELSDLDSILKQHYVYTPPKKKATPEMLKDFFDIYLPPKISIPEETLKDVYRFSTI